MNYHEIILDTITKMVLCKFNCITVNFDRTLHGIYMIQNFIISIIKRHGFPYERTLREHL